MRLSKVVTQNGRKASLVKAVSKGRLLGAISQQAVTTLVLTAAMVDRLTHKALMVNMTGNSYRMKETKEMIASFNA